MQPKTVKPAPPNVVSSVLSKGMSGSPAAPQSWPQLPDGYVLVPRVSSSTAPSSSLAVGSARPSDGSDGKNKVSVSASDRKYDVGTSGGGCSREEAQAAGYRFRNNDSCNPALISEVVKRLQSAGTDEQKAVLSDYLKLIQQIMAVSVTPSEIKYFMYHSPVVTLDTTTVYSAGNFRFPTYYSMLNIAEGTGEGQRTGVQIRLRRFDLQINITAEQLYQDANAAEEVRFYPVKFALWKPKVTFAITVSGAMDITGYGVSKEPGQAAAFYWDPFDTATRTGTSIAEDTAMAAVHSPDPISKENNECLWEHVWLPTTQAAATGAAAGVDNSWENTPGDGRRSPYIRFVRDFHHGGLKVAYVTDGTQYPSLNNMVLCAITDKPPATDATTCLRYRFHFISHAYYTDA